MSKFPLENCIRAALPTADNGDEESTVRVIALFFAETLIVCKPDEEELETGFELLLQPSINELNTVGTVIIAAPWHVFTRNSLRVNFINLSSVILFSTVRFIKMIFNLSSIKKIYKVFQKAG